MSHNGEINTLRGNKTWMRAREGVVQSDLFGDELQKLFPVVEPDCSDSGHLRQRARVPAHDRPHPARVGHDDDPRGVAKSPYDVGDEAGVLRVSLLLDGAVGWPASIAFTDGRYIGAVLDRNGLRPSRYYLTHDDRVIMASEVGVLPVDPANVKGKRPTATRPYLPRRFRAGPHDSRC